MCVLRVARISPKQIFTIEPMLNLGDEWRDMSWPDDWTVTTTDGAPSAAAEETLLVTETGIEILTAQGGPRAIDTTDARERQLHVRRERRGSKGLRIPFLP